MENLMEEYEVYPGRSARAFAEEFLSRSPISLQAFCKNERIPLHELPRLVEAVLAEWAVKDETHFSRREALNHLINHIRTKSQHERQSNRPQGRTAVTGEADRYSALENAADTILFNSPHGLATQDD